MSRNHTEYHLVKRDECGYWDCLRTVRTFNQARRAFAVTGAERIDRWRRTPSKSSLQEVCPGREREQPLRRIIHKYYRREADAKKRNACMVTVFDGKKWAKFRYSEWKFDRYVAGVRKGTIL